jgi:hypothetical protein
MREHEERWKELCRRASVEQDSEKLGALIKEINQLLRKKAEPFRTPESELDEAQNRVRANRSLL